MGKIIYLLGRNGFLGVIIGSCPAPARQFAAGLVPIPNRKKNCAADISEQPKYGVDERKSPRNDSSEAALSEQKHAAGKDACERNEVEAFRFLDAPKNRIL